MGSAYAEKYAVLTNVESSISTWLNRSKIKAIDFRKISCEAIQKKHFLPKAIPKKEKGVTVRWRLFLCELACEIFTLDLRKIYFQKPSTSPKGNLRVIRVPPCS